MYVVLLLCCKVVGCSGLGSWGRGVVENCNGFISSKPGKFNVTSTKYIFVNYVTSGSLSSIKNSSI